jgi:tRNA (guanine-N7-)-methyltransferase
MTQTDEHAAAGVDGERQHRHVRSFVRRGGRITAAQAKALDELWPRYGVDFSPRAIDLDALFGRHAERVLEVGFGNGETLLALAARHPERDFLGIEVHEPGVGRVLLNAKQADLANIRVSRHDAVEVLEHQLPPSSFAEILIFFPDPWPKKRHHKRRLIQPPFVNLLASRLQPEGVLRLATDWEHYSVQMLEVLSACEMLRNAAPTGAFAERPASRPPTRFEKRGRRLGHGVWDLEFRRRGARELTSPAE